MEPCEDEAVDTQPGAYYVGCFDPHSPKKHYLMSGPYETHQESLDMVEKSRSIAEDSDSRAVWMAFGTCRYPVGHTQIGRLQKMGYTLRLEPQPKVTATA